MSDIRLGNGDQHSAHQFVGVAEYLQLTFLHVSSCGGQVHLKEVVVLICEALLNVEVCFLPSMVTHTVPKQLLC